MAHPDYYAILGVLPSAEDIVIKAAFRALAQRYHPDKYVGDPAEAERTMKEINEAYSVLSDPSKRKAYDSERKGNAMESEDAFRGNEADSPPPYDPTKEDGGKDSPFFPDHSRWKDLSTYGRIGLALSGLSFVLSLLFAWKDVRSTLADGKDVTPYLGLVFAPLLITLPVGVFVITTNKIVKWSDVRQPLGLTRDVRKGIGQVLFGLLGIIWVISLVVKILNV